MPPFGGAFLLESCRNCQWILAKINDILISCKGKDQSLAMEVLEIKREIEMLSERLGKTQDYL